MRLKVVGPRVMIKVAEATEQFNKDVPEFLRSKDFEVAMSGNDQKRWYEASQEGVVVQVGETCWTNPALGYGTDAWKPWCKPGDRIMFVQYAKDVVVDPDTKEKFFVINDVDVLTRVGE